MPDQETVIKLQTLPTTSGFDVLIINAGIAKGWDLNFSAQVLKDSLTLWESLPCFLDHDFSGNQSVRNLAGALHTPVWNEKETGIQASLIPGGPGAKDLQDLYLAAKADPAILAAVGFSAHLYVIQDGGIVKRITKAHSVDCVIDPSRGGKFLSTRNIQGAKMKKKVLREGKVIEIEEKDLLPTDEIITKLASPPPTSPPPAALDPGTEAETQALLAAQAATKTAEGKNRTAAESLRQVRLQTCRNLLQVSLEASHLPTPSATRVEKRFNKQLDKGEPFEPGELEVAIGEEQALLSELTAAGAIQGPGRISGMSTNADQLEAAVDDLFGVKRDVRLANVKPAHLTGIRELYLMLTGDWDLHGGYYGERIQLAITTDFTGLVKNALNKIVAQQWEALGKAGYDWWEKIVKIEHFTSLNDITGTLIGTVGTLPTVAENGEYTELAIGDSPETASFTKYGGYIPLSLELIDRDETRKLKAYASELGSAARRKISALVSQVFLANSDIGPTMADGGALFNATAVTAATGHANLLTTALSAAQWDVVCAAVFAQPMLIKHSTGYYGTGPKMAINPRYLVVPRALQLTAMKILYPSLENLANIYSENQQRGQPGDVVVMPEYIEVDHWAAVCDPVVAPAIIIGERFGIQPEIFTAGNETDPAVFMNDEHRIKVRMFNAVLVQDHRPLHKSNV
jgi:hypothetical protein